MSIPVAIIIELVEVLVAHAHIGRLLVRGVSLVVGGHLRCLMVSLVEIGDHNSERPCLGSR